MNSAHQPFAANMPTAEMRACILPKQCSPLLLPRGRVGRLAASCNLYAKLCTSDPHCCKLVVSTTKMDNALVFYAHKISDSEPLLVVSADNASEFPRVMNAVLNADIWLRE